MRDKDTRKVQQVGGTTLTVSIPKDWADAVSLDAGDEVTFVPNEDGSLRLETDHSGKERPITYVIDADACEDNLLARLIVAGYIIGYEKLRVEKDDLDHETVDAVHRVARRLTGLDIVDRGETYLELHNFMEVSQSGVYALVRRLQTTVLHMLDSCIYALVQEREDLLSEVHEMEDEVDVLYWLVLRQLLSAVDDPQTMDEAGVESPLHVVGNRTVIKSLEGIADSIEGISDEIEVLLAADVGLETAEQELLAEITEAIHEQIETVTEGLITMDVEGVNSIMEQESVTKTAGDEFLDRLQQSTDDVSMIVAGHKVIWYLEQVEEYCEFIAEIAINRVMEEGSEYGEIVDRTT